MWATFNHEDISFVTNNDIGYETMVSEVLS
jgi:hypothetical protein